jgi:hypothetical protein
VSQRVSGGDSGDSDDSGRLWLLPVAVAVATVVTVVCDRGQR